MTYKIKIIPALVLSAGIVFGVMQQPTSSFAEDTKQTHRFEYVPSKLGIDYRALAPSPLAEMLSQGEVEWLKNAPVDYGEDTNTVWQNELIPQIATGAVSQITIENLRDFTPNMLTKFTALNPQDEKYGYLWSIGNLFVAERLAGKA